MGFDFMAHKLQPIVGDSQQLIVISAKDNVQPMVVNSRDEEKAAFSRRLANACAEFPECPGEHGRAAWLARQFTPALSSQAVLKWFKGESMPDMTNIPRLAGILKVDASWLLAGPGDAVVREFAPDEALQKVIRAWPEMGDEMRKRLEHLADLTLPLPDK